MIVDQQTKLYGVVGYPVGHSLSPVMHNAAFAEKGLNAVYLAFETKDIDGCIKGMRAFGIRGMSITIPHKSEVMPLLDEVNGLAKRIGAVNTICNDKGRLVGYNTDAVGAITTLEQKVELTGKTCTILGAGGAARAIGFILKENGVEVKVANRSSKRGRALAYSLECQFLSLDQLGKIPSDIVINTTPVGMAPRTDQCPVPEQSLTKGMVVMDIIYNPIETRLLTIAKARGCVTINGVGMFIHQGAEQFRLWTGLEAPIDTMRHAVEEALKKNERD
jgi:shikimate dehydrogenase